MSQSYAIGQLSRVTKCKVPTIRYYEQIGLLSAPSRSAGNQRRYSETHVQQLKFIRHGRDLGFDIADIKQLLHLSHCSSHDPHEAGRIAAHHLASVNARIQRLNALKSELEFMIKDCCDTERRSCRVLEVLADHRLCHGDHG